MKTRTMASSSCGTCFEHLIKHSVTGPASTGISVGRQVYPDGAGRCIPTEAGVSRGKEVYQESVGAVQVPGGSLASDLFSVISYSAGPGQQGFKRT